MGCRCHERRQQIGTAAKQVVAGDLKAAAANMTNVARTMREDAGAVVRSAGHRLAIASAHARLKR